MPKALDADRCALLLIDFQARLEPAILDASASLAAAAKLARAAALVDVPIIATEQTPDRLGPTIAPVAGLAAATLAKSTFDACRGAALVAALGGRNTAVVTGWEAHVCVLQTALGLIEAGVKVAVVTEAVASRRAESKAAALARLERAGAELVTLEMVIFEWLADAAHPRFREALALVK